MSDLQKLIQETLDALKEKSFSQRHPELGKMINCQVCLRRHRQIEGCRQVGLLWVHRDGDRPLTRNQIFGRPLRRNFSSPRYNPHLKRGKYYRKGKHVNPISAEHEHEHETENND